MAHLTASTSSFQVANLTSNFWQPSRSAIGDILPANRAYASIVWFIGYQQKWELM